MKSLNAEQVQTYPRTDNHLVGRCAQLLVNRIDEEVGFTSLVEFTPETITTTNITKDNCNDVGGRYACEGKGVFSFQENILKYPSYEAAYLLRKAMQLLGEDNASFIIGGWRDRKGYYIGNTFLTNSKKEAEQYCKQEGEIAFWDIQENKECRIPHRGTLSDMAAIIRTDGVQKVEAFLNASIDAGDARPIEDFKVYAPQSCGTETQRRTVRQLFIREVVEAAKAEMY